MRIFKRLDVGDSMTRRKTLTITRHRRNGACNGTPTTFVYAWLREDHLLGLANSSGWNDLKMHRATMAKYKNKFVMLADGANVGSNWQIGVYTAPV